MPKKPRVNKTKTEIALEMGKQERVKQNIAIVKSIFPFISDLASVYDAQTALSALAGFITLDLQKKNNELKVSDLNIDLSKEKDSVIKDSVQNILGLVVNENAKDVATLLQRFSDTLAQFSAKEYMKQPMKVITVEDFVV